MPLVKSPKKTAFVKNLKEEISVGKPQKQAVAIAFSVKRKALEDMEKKAVRK